jgi:hypothetical protein
MTFSLLGLILAAQMDELIKKGCDYLTAKVSTYIRSNSGRPI